MKKTFTAMTAVAIALGATATSEAQFLGRLGGAKPRSAPASAVPPAQGAESSSATAASMTNQAAAAKDPNLARTNVVIPEPVNPKDLPPPKFPLPAEPIEPYLLTQEAGPFMVLAHTFKGPYAEKSAQALAMELRSHYRLPAYVLRPKDFPMRSLIRGLPPTANKGINRPELMFPDIERVKDEAAVLVGDEKSEDDSEKLLHKVKGLRPDCMEYLPDWHPTNALKIKGLRRAIRTTNPYAPAETLFPRKPDAFVTHMNQGHHSIYQCPGRYSLQIAEFAGRADLGDAKAISGKNQSMLSLTHSPLKTAHEDAEKLADSLSKDKSVMQAGYVPYVYHDRTSSRVFIGSFNASNDPNAVKLHNFMKYMAGYLNNAKVADVMVVPATALTDLTQIKVR